ncbi:MAG TPA: sugar ABC transporter ATP-binding protein [Vicinamibacterales bacterium]|nr:sugar ABC transporter ATP-binding protein [Vicinamibacterales bacterium]
MARPVAPRLEMRGVSKAFGATLALDCVDLTVDPGEVCGLVGQNGAGKSTLMAVLAGAVPSDAGTMRLDGVPYAPRDPLAAREAGVAMIHQELSVAPQLTVMENIALGVEPVRGPGGILDRRRMRAIAADALAELGHAEIAPDAIAADLPPAAQQLVEIARARAIGCRVLVLDEPTSSLTHGDVRTLFDLIGRLAAQRIAVVYISHFIEEVKQVADRFVVLRDGRNAGGGLTRNTGCEAIVSLMVGRSVDDLYPRGRRERGGALLEVEALQPGDATFALHRGEVVGIAGLLGAGRTRLLRTIFGLEPVRSGRIRVAAYSGPAAPHERWRQGLGMLSEDRAGEGIARGLTIADNITLSHLAPLGPRGLVWPSRQRAAAAQWIERLDIRCTDARQPVAELSGGNQQKVAVARLLHHGVDALILDEPTKGIDVGSKAQIYRLIDEMVSAGKAVLLVSSYFPELLGVCDRIAVMSRGRLGPVREVAEWTEHALLMEASGARASQA